jgi:hypothetical protein
VKSLAGRERRRFRKSSAASLRAGIPISGPVAAQP